MEQKKQYIAPTLTVVTFKAEHGYAGSGMVSMALFQMENDAYNAYGQENWEEEGNLFGSW